MIKCHFIDVIKTFNPDELEAFGQYLDSTYFNRRKKLVELYSIIRIYYPLFTDINFTREKIFSKLYPSEKFSYGKINEGLSSLHRLVLNFLRQISFEKNEIFPDIVFLEELRKRSLKNIFKLQSDKMVTQIDQFVDLDSNTFLKQYLLEIENANYTMFFGKKKKKENIEDYVARLTKIVTAITNFYIAELISVSASNFTYSGAYSNNTNSIFSKIHDSELLNNLFNLIKPFNKYDSYLQLLNYFFDAIHDIDNKEKYYNYKKIVFENINKMSVDDIDYHMACLKSYCIVKRKVVKNTEEFSKEYLNLQETILEKKLFVNSKSQFFITGSFFNMLSNYDTLKNKHKIKNLLSYIKFLPPDDRDDMKYMTEAHYHFLNYSFDKVLISLDKIKTNNRTFEERINNLQVRSLYEMRNFVDCLDKIILFKKQYRASKMLSKKRIESEMLFLNSVEKLIKFKENSSNFDAEYLKNRIEKDEFIPSKEWLIEKCYELYDKPKQAYQYQ
ncbi:MAG: hypothetical protein JST55_09130 [Bacteroidetes bacterium]|nr:hypothetical protein [Bacteroidota bacterium]